MDRNRRPILVVLIVWIGLLSFYNLEGAPPFWWDEGWTLTAARNWIERGHYGPFLVDQPAPRGMEGAFTYTLPISLAFRFFGVGVYQGRFVQVLYTLAMLGLLGYIAWRCWGANVAVASLAVLTIMPGYPSLHPIVLGRQVLGEAPAFCYLMAGYACLLVFLPRRESLAVCFTVIFWSLAINTKTQIVYFWAVALLVPLMLTVLNKQWRLALLLAAVFVCSLAVAEFSLARWSNWIEPQTVPRTSVIGMYQAIATGGTLPARMFSIIALIKFGLPTFLGIGYGVWRFLKAEKSALNDVDVVKLSLLTLATCWFGWYICLSVGWIRYLFPAALIGSLFFAKFLAELTSNFNALGTLRQAWAAVSQRQLTVFNLRALLAVLVIVISVPQGLGMLYQVYFVGADASVKEAARFLNSHTASNALIESYDSELFFFLDRPYHFPTDQLHVDLIRRTFLYEQNRRIDYDPLQRDPDYLVIGPQTKQWRLYEPVIEKGAFRLVRNYPRYQIYKRVR